MVVRVGLVCSTACISANNVITTSICLEPCTPQLGMDEEASNMSTASASAKKKFTKEILEER